MEMSNLKKEIATILFAYNDSIAINKIKELRVYTTVVGTENIGKENPFK
jgi:hypothetical protein